MYTVSYTILYDVIYVYTTFYMMYIMNTTCTLIHQTSIVTGHRYTFRHFRCFFQKHVFLLVLDLPILWKTSGSLFKTSWIGQRWWPWLQNPPLMEAKAPEIKAAEPPKRKGWKSPFATIFQNKHVCFRVCMVCNIYIYYILYLYFKL